MEGVGFKVKNGDNVFFGIIMATSIFLISDSNVLFSFDFLPCNSAVLNILLLLQSLTVSSYNKSRDAF